MAVKLGLDGKTYRNTGTYATPIWNEVKNIKDLKLPIEKGSADVTTRLNNGWGADKATLKRASIDFQMVDDPLDDDIIALTTAFFAGTTVEFAILDGDIVTAGTQGLRATMDIFKFERTEGLEEAMMFDVTIKPTFAANAPAWVTTV